MSRDLASQPQLVNEQDYSAAALEAKIVTLEKEREAASWSRDLEEALKSVKGKLDAASTGSRAPLFFEANAFLRRKFQTAQWQVTGLVTKGGTTVAAGEPKAAIKTWLLVEGAIAIATGTKMCGEFFAEQGTAAIFFAEDQEQGIYNRVHSLLAGASRTLADDRLFLQPRGEFIDLLKDEDLAWVVASARRLPKLDLLVLDPLRDVHSGEEDKSDSMRDVMRRLRVLGELLGCTVWISHHVAKSNKETGKRRIGQGMRGSSAIHGSIDSGLYIEPLDGDGTNTFNARVTSQVKSGRSAGTFDLRLVIDDDDNGQATRAGWTFTRQDAALKGGAGQKVNSKDREAAEKRAAHAKDDDKVFAWVCDMARRGTRLNRTALKQAEDRPLSQNKTLAALERLIEAGRFVLFDGYVTLPELPSARVES